MKRPASQFYWADWLRDPAVRASSIDARGLWMDMLALMHEGEPYGHLTVGGAAVTDAQLARMVGETPARTKKLREELERHRVFSRTAAGTIFSRRMVRDEWLRDARAESGKLGGHRSLGAEHNVPGFVYAMRRASDGAIKIGISAQPEKRRYQVGRQFPGVAIALLAKRYVDDMGAAEGRLHALYAHRASGEWFSLDANETRELLMVHLKENGKGNGKENPKRNANATPPPSSSSSSSGEGEREPEGSLSFSPAVRVRLASPSTYAPPRTSSFCERCEPAKDPATGFWDHASACPLREEVST